MLAQVPICLPQIPDLVTQPFNQVQHDNLLNINQHAWLLEPLASENRVSLKQWRTELKLLREAQPGPSMRQSGSFLKDGTTIIRWTSGRLL